MGSTPSRLIAEISIADDFKTVLWPLPGDDTAEDWALRRSLWDDPDVMLGGSDAGAHLDRMLGSSYPTRFIADSLRGRKLVPIERAVQLLTDVPARLFGLRDRGRLAEGWCADVVVLRPGDRRQRRRPGGSTTCPATVMRLTADSIGVRRVLVNGTEAVVDGAPTGALAGTVLRSGRDTETVATN